MIYCTDNILCNIQKYYKNIFTIKSILSYDFVDNEDIIFIPVASSGSSMRYIN